MIRTQHPAVHPESRLERGGLVMEIGRDSATLDSPSQGAEKDGPGKSKSRKSTGRPLVGPQCAVCGEEAPLNGPYRRHYGVICCEACKCFFRRTVQMNKQYECKLTGNCAVGKNVRHWCQACRFQKCLRSGMKIDAVKGLGVNKKSKDQGKRGRDDRRDDSRNKIVKYEKSDSSDGGDVGEDLLSHPVTSPDTCLGHIIDRKNGGSGKEMAHVAPEFAVYSMGPSYSPLNLSLASPIPKINSPPSVSTLSKKLQASENAKQEELEMCPTGRMTSPPSMMAACGGYYPVYGKGGGVGGGYGGSSHHTSPLTPVVPTPSYPVSYQSTPCPSACPSPYHHSACHSANNTPYTTPYGTPVASPVSNRNTPHVTPLQSPAPSPTPHLFVNPPYPINTPSLPSYSEGLISGNNSPAHSHRSHATSCPVSPISGANSPSAFTATSFPFSTTKMGPSTFVDLQPTLSMAGRLQPLQGMPGRGRHSFELSAFSGSSTRLPDVSTVIKTHVLQEPSMLPSITPTLGNPATRPIPTPPIPTPQTASTSSTQVPTKRAPILQNLPEAEVEEVLDSLRLRITAMFKWAKSEVAGFEDLSPLDQKALLRRTVAELVMLGFARASIAFDGMLRLGGTGKAIRPSHENSGIASVANITLARLVTPLKVLNIDDKELELLKEIVLFNSEADGLRSRELVRQLRKKRLIELMEYTKNGEPGRFGELMCLLTPLFEVSLEVTEQLRLEQFVYEGEARIDALLLMSMINDAGNIDVSVDSVS